MIMMDIKASFNKCVRKIIENDYKGYDPYDGASSRYSWIRENYYPRLVSTYLNKFNPVNLRPLLGIDPSRQNQALGFIGRALLLYPEKQANQVEQVSNILTGESLYSQYGYHCWDAHGFVIQIRGDSHQPGMTDVIGNEAIGRFFLELYRNTSENEYRDICVSVKDFFLNKYFNQNNNSSYFKYKPHMPKGQWCYNASAIAAAFIAAVSVSLENKEIPEQVEAAFKNIISKQKPEGEWWYSLNFNTGHEKPQVDFHQGFILDALLEYMDLTQFKEPFLDSYIRGLEFYHKKQFLPNGQGIYRYPRKWPVNIHNQAQGIITFTCAAKAGFGDHYFDFAHTIAEWTIKHMQGPDGHFYFLKYPWFTNKIPYIRWSDAAMTYALAVFLDYEKVNG